MSEIIRPTWEDLQAIVSSANEQLLICSPFYSAEGIGRVFDDLSNFASLKFWTRLSPSDWTARVSDPDQLLALLDILDGNGSDIELGVSQRLHAKAYAADHDLALIGSANLSEGGFGRNLELAVRFRDEEAAEAVGTLMNFCTPFLRIVTLEQLRTWVETFRTTIEEARSAMFEEPEILAPVQAELDRILNFGGTDSSIIAEPNLSDMEDFVGWLKNNITLPGAEVLYRRHNNLDQQNLQGHFRQGFFGSKRFLSEHPELCTVLSEELGRLDQDDIYPLDTSSLITDAWQEHLDAHATDSSDNYNYATLRTILPPSLGGTRSGGGGGSSTVKRMLPLVARFTLESTG